jgi:ActR/RegA family two-component response regulator
MKEATPVVGEPHKLMLVDLPLDFSAEIMAQAQSNGCFCWTVDAGRFERNALHPDLIIVNLDCEDALPTISHLRAQMTRCEIAGVTTISSVTRIVEAIRRGASTVVARPTTLGQIAAAVYQTMNGASDSGQESLDRTIWRFLNQVVSETGSISGAARRLRVDRTSLKRMLRKSPPAR